MSTAQKQSDTPITSDWAELSATGHTVPADICAQLERENESDRAKIAALVEALRAISVADWKTSGELRGIARAALAKEGGK